MTFVLPTINNAHAVVPTSNTLFLASLNSPVIPIVKVAGNLPITNSAGEWENNTVAALKGVAYDFQASQAGYDVSGDTLLFVWHHQLNASRRMQIDSLGNAGFMVRIYSGTGTPPSNYREFHLGGNDTPFASAVPGVMPYVIDLSDSSHEASGGTFDDTDITAYAPLTTKFDQAGTASNRNFSPTLYVFTTVKGNASTPTFSGSGSSFQDAVALIQGSDYTDKVGNWVRQIGSAIFIDVAFRIGNNSTITTFDDGGLTIVSPVSDDPNDPRNRLTTQACRVYLDLRSNSADTATFSGTYFWGTRAPWDFDQDDAAIVTFSSPTFIGMGAFTVGSSITGPATWDDTGSVVIADTGVDIDGSVFRNAFQDPALSLPGAMDIADMIFSGYGSAHAILIDTAGTYGFDNITFDGSGTADVENTSGGAVVLQISGGGTVPTVTNTGGGSTTTIEQPSTLTLTGLVTNTEVRAYDAGTQDEVDGVENSGTSFAIDFDAQQITSLDIVIHHINYVHIRLEAVAVVAGAVTIPIQQLFDNSFSNPD